MNIIFHINFQKTMFSAHKHTFSPLFSADIYQKGFCMIDLSAQNPAVLALDLRDLVTCENYIKEACQGKVGMGGYGEKRAWYAQSPIFRAETQARNIHLGIDIWLEAGTPIYNFLAGKVHSFAYNEGFGNYGGTIIVQYELQEIASNPTVFYVLYGHLSKESLENLTENKVFEKGSQIATLGEPSENGGWATHLHIQVIKDMQGQKGDFVGVCYEKDKDFYLNLCPNPVEIIFGSKDF